MKKTTPSASPPFFNSFSLSARESDKCRVVEQNLVDDKWILVFLVPWSANKEYWLATISYEMALLDSYH